MKSNILKIYVTVFVALFSFLSNAQPVDPPADGDPPAAPINSYLIWLAVLGITFILYILNKRNSIKESK
ncbi:MAG: hypothetical protein KYX68_03540 [Flavobacterium sp.]|nr:hypothetical protein [Flavobacterium sp.]